MASSTNALNAKLTARLEDDIAIGQLTPALVDYVQYAYGLSLDDDADLSCVASESQVVAQQITPFYGIGQIEPRTSCTSKTALEGIDKNSDLLVRIINAVKLVPSKRAIKIALMDCFRETSRVMRMPQPTVEAWSNNTAQRILCLLKTGKIISCGAGKRTCAWNDYGGGRDVVNAVRANWQNMPQRSRSASPSPQVCTRCSYRTVATHACARPNQQTNQQTNNQTHKHTNTKTNKQTNTHTHTMLFVSHSTIQSLQTHACESRKVRLQNHTSASASELHIGFTESHTIEAEVELEQLGPSSASASPPFSSSCFSSLFRSHQGGGSPAASLSFCTWSKSCKP